MNPPPFLTFRKPWVRILFAALLVLLIALALFLWLTQRGEKTPVSGLPEKLAFYYGFPSRVNDSGGDVKKATQVFKDYDIVVFGNTLDSPANQDHAAAETIVHNLKADGTRVYGYVDLCYEGGNYCSSLPLSEIYASTDRWAAMGVKGIFFDQVGYEYSVSRDRLNAAVDYVHSKGLSAFINVWDPDDVFSQAVQKKFNPFGTPPHLGPEDYFLHESFAVTLSQYQDPAFLIEKSEKGLKWKKIYGTKMATVNTVDFSNPPFNAEQANYVWWATYLYGFDAMAWGETGIYSADCQCLPFHTRPAIGDFGSPIEPLTVAHTGSMYRRSTTTGTIELDTAAHTGRFIPGLPSAAPRVQNFITQPGAASTDLISGNAVFLWGAGQLNVTVQSNGAPIDSYRIFVDRDMNAATGFLHKGNSTSGADFLVEDGQLYQFAGPGQADWNWTLIEPVTVRGVGTDRIQASLPFTKIGYTAGGNLGILVERLESAQGKASTLLPFSPGVWIAQSAPKRADNQAGQQGSKGSDLVYGSVIFKSDTVIFTIRSQETPISSYRIYLDLDVDPTTGFLHQGNALIGADYLVEDGQLFQFDAARQTNWTWSALGPIEVTGVGSREVQVTVPCSQIGYLSGKNLAALAENLGPANQASLDILPRSPGMWAIEYVSKDVVAYFANEVTQSGDKGTDLTLGSIAFEADALHFILQSKETPIDSYRIFLDMDANKDTGFTHFRNVHAGSEYLIENGKLYHFTGTSAVQWSWPEVGPVDAAGAGTTQIEVTVPFSQVGYSAGEKLGILIENLDPSWVTYDLVPRSPGMWQAQ